MLVGRLRSRLFSMMIRALMETDQKHLVTRFGQSVFHESLFLLSELRSIAFLFHAFLYQATIAESAKSVMLKRFNTVAEIAAFAQMVIGTAVDESVAEEVPS